MYSWHECTVDIKNKLVLHSKCFRMRKAFPAFFSCENNHLDRLSCVVYCINAALFICVCFSQSINTHKFQPASLAIIYILYKVGIRGLKESQIPIKPWLFCLYLMLWEGWEVSFFCNLSGTPYYYSTYFMFHNGG